MTAVRGFRFAVQATKATSASEWREVASQTEDLGYSTLFLADHYLGPGPAGSSSLLEPQHLAPIAAMATAAAWTTTLRVGCRVFCTDYHVPAVLAKEAATIDLLSNGRLEFGIGAGWFGDEYAAMGLTFGQPALRVSKLEEVVAMIKAHFSGEQMDCVGDHVSVRGYGGLPIPVQRPHPPIMIGGSKKRVLSLAARQADIVSIANVPWQDLDPHAEALRRIGFVREVAGERFAALDIETSPSYSEVTDDVDATLRRASPSLRNADPEVLRHHPNVLVGSVEQIIDTLQQRREEFSVNYVTIPGDQLVTFAPVVARLAGT